MADNTSQTIASGTPLKGEASIDLRPTLFIGVGGTGMEVLMRVRRRILNHLWGGVGVRSRVESLSDFPIAQFIQFDLDAGAVIDSGRAQADDLQYEAVKFTDEDKIVESFDIEKYSRDDDALEKYPHVKEWLSLNPKKIRELKIDPAKGRAHQLDGSDDFLGVFGIQLDIDGVDVGKALEQHRLALHHRL